jgi:hypothetical protein
MEESGLQKMTFIYTFIASLLMVTELNAQQMVFQTEPLDLTFQEDYFFNQIEGIENADFEMRGVGGKEEIKKIHNVNLDWKGINLKQDFSYSFNLGTIPCYKTRKFGILIGYDSSKRRELTSSKFYCKNQLFTFTGLSFISDHENIRLDRILGCPLLKAALGSINIRKKQLWRWELNVKSEDPIHLVISKKKIKITKPFTYSYSGSR